MQGNLAAGQTLRIRRTWVDSLQVEKCRGSEQMQQQAQTCGISDDSDTATWASRRLVTPLSTQYYHMPCGYYYHK